MATPAAVRNSLSEIHEHWPYWLTTGGVLVALGILSLVAPAATTFPPMAIFGAVMLVAGAAQIIPAIRDKDWTGSVPFFSVGLIELGVGVYLLVRPVESEGALALTVLVALFLVVIGILQVGMSVSARFGGAGWLLAAGIATLASGLVLYAGWYAAWPAPRLWLAAACVGASLLCRGLATSAIAIEARRDSGTTVRPT